MSEIDLKPLFEYLDEHFKDVKNDIAEVRQDVRQVQTSVDGLAKMVKEFQEEIIVNRKRLERLENWAKQVSSKLGIPLPADF